MCHWKRSLQRSIGRGAENGDTLPTANKYLFDDLSTFTSTQSNEATSPSFVERCTPIEASSASLEALIVA